MGFSIIERTEKEEGKKTVGRRPKKKTTGADPTRPAQSRGEESLLQSRESRAKPQGGKRMKLGKPTNLRYVLNGVRDHGV